MAVRFNPANDMRALLIAALSFALGGCQLIYKLPTRQGNVIEQKQLDQLKTGMTREQVIFLLGTPLAASPFRDSRWDYLGYYKSPRGQVTQRSVAIHFENDAVVRLEGAEKPADGSTAVLGTDDAKAVIQQEKKDRVEAERAQDNTETGVILTPTPAP